MKIPEENLEDLLKNFSRKSQEGLRKIFLRGFERNTGEKGFLEKKGILGERFFLYGTVTEF